MGNYTGVYNVTLTPGGARLQWDFASAGGGGDSGEHLTFAYQLGTSSTYQFNLSPTSLAYKFDLDNYPPSFFDNTDSDGKPIFSVDMDNSNTSTLVLTSDGSEAFNASLKSLDIQIILYVVDPDGEVHASPDPTADPQNTR